jgi:RimJ/RimL family protein N-acetyltransferase
MQVPTLETDRLVMREFRADDFEPMAMFYADPVSRFYGGPCGREEAWRKFAMYPGHWTLRGYGPWALELRSTGEYVGLCGLWYPDGWIEPEITWALIPEFHGHGYATEAAGRALRAAYDDFGWNTAISVIALDNAASVAVATRLGARFEAEVEYRYGRAALYRHVAPEARPTAV